MGLGVLQCCKPATAEGGARKQSQTRGWDATTIATKRHSVSTIATSFKKAIKYIYTVFLMKMATVAARTAVDFYAEYDGKLLKLFLYSRE